MTGSSFLSRAWVCSLLAGVGVIALLGSERETAIAQNVIVPDETLGAAERSQVGPVTINGIQVDGIQGGAARGINLFHSFLNFNVAAGQGAYFIKPTNQIQNILARVTGSNRSDIFGTLGTARPPGVTASVNLFLINPNGIVFGSNASLNVGGSFYATTANAVKLGSGGLFSASQPASSNLLSVDPSAFLFNAIANQNLPEIVVRSRADTTVLGRATNGLQVPNGQTLLLLGGNVNVDGGRILASGGRAEIGAIVGLGTLGLNTNGSLQFPDGIQRGDVSFANVAEVGVNLDRGGDIGITAKNISVLGRSELNAGIRSGFGAVGNQAGDITLNATGDIQVGQDSLIWNLVFPNAIGNAGNTNITASSLVLTGNSQISASTFGTGDAGNVLITARERILFQNSYAFSSVEVGGRGKGGNVVIDTPVLEVRDGAGLIASTSGIGDAGNVLITARERILFQNSYAFSSVEVGGRGKGGNVVIDTSVLEVRDGAGLIASTSGIGDAGNVLITARDRVLFQGSSADGLPSAAFSSVEATGTGKGGNVMIDTPVLEVRDSARLISSSDGVGDAGNVQITARERVLFQNGYASSSLEAGGTGKGGNVVIDTSVLEVRDGAELLASTSGIGDAGNVLITARERALFQGTDGQFGSSAFSNVQSGGEGRGGNVVIDTSVLEVRNGGELIASSLGIGDAGNVLVNARDRIVLDGTDSTSGRPSAIYTDNGTNTQLPNTGAGGNIFLTTPSLSVSNGAVINSSTTNDRPGGNITLSLGQLNLLGGGHISATSSGSGLAGTITIIANDQIRISGNDPTYAARLAQFSIPNSLIYTAGAPIPANSGIYVRSSSTGPAGDIVLTTPRLTLDQQGRIDAQSATVSGGNLFLTVPSLLLLRNGSQITATAGSGNPQAPGDGGNVNINARFIVAIPKENSDITANATKGRGGNVSITSQGIFGLQFRPQLTSLSDITATSEFGISGTVNLITPDNSALQNSLTQLAQNLIDPNTLLANSCIVRNRQQNGSFLITGSGGLPVRPGDAPPASFPTGEVRSLPTTQSQNNRPWQLGDPIVEPQGIYRLPNGKLVMSRECQTQ